MQSQAKTQDQTRAIPVSNFHSVKTILHHLLDGVPPCMKAICTSITVSAQAQSSHDGGALEASQTPSAEINSTLPMERNRRDALLFLGTGSATLWALADAPAPALAGLSSYNVTPGAAIEEVGNDKGWQVYTMWAMRGRHDKGRLRFGHLGLRPLWIEFFLH